MSDEELDREWKPTGRPQSTMARSFSLALNDVFKMDNSLADLDAAVEQKKRAVSSQTAELQALEARLKATEERLKQSQSMNFASSSNRSSPSSRQRVPLGETFGQAHAATEEPRRLPSSHSNTESRPKTPTRPSTSRRPVPSHNVPPMPSYSAPPMPGALPPTPGASEGEFDPRRGLRTRSSADYVVVDKDEDRPLQQQDAF